MCKLHEEEYKELIDFAVDICTNKIQVLGSCNANEIMGAKKYIKILHNSGVQGIMCAMFFFIEAWATKAVASLVRGEGQEKHLSQPNVPEKSALLLFPLESMCWEASAPLQAACVSLPRFSHLYCALVCSAKSRPSGSSPASHVVGLAQCGVPGLCFHRHDSTAAV